MSTYAAYREAFAGIPKPFAFLDLDMLNLNISLSLVNAGAKQIRIASKSIRSVDAIRHIMSADTRFIGMMCYAAEEALMLSSLGFRDLLLGYPIWDESQIDSIARRTREGEPITLMVDSREHVEHIERIARRVGARMPVCLDIDLSMDFFGIHFGVWRSPLRQAEGAVEVAERIAASPHLTLDGVMGYEAQIAGVGDANPHTRLRNRLIRYLKRRSLPMIAETRAALIGELHSRGIAPRFVNGGGTGSLASTRTEDAVTEVTIGSGFYAPGLFDNYQDFRYMPAAGYAIEIVRKPRSDIYTCLGGGYIASGAIALDKQPKVILPAGAELMPLEGAGEVQTPIRYLGSEPLKLGDPIFLRHAKAGELCERFTKLYVYSPGQDVFTMSTYRGDGKCFL